MSGSTAQDVYHRHLFGSLLQWQQASASIVDSGLKGLDELGHFGRPGCDLLVRHILEYRSEAPISILELGCGIGGTIRYVAEQLQGRAQVDRAVGVDIVDEHVRVAELSARDLMPDLKFEAICASASDTGLTSGDFDVIFITGSASHFSDMFSVLKEASRLLAPGGLLVFTEEVSLLKATGSMPSARFRSAHSASVFHMSTFEQRRIDLGLAGFSSTEIRPISEWAITTLRTRSMSMRINSARLKAFYGSEQADLLRETIDSALEEIERGTIVPALAIARSAP